MEPRDEQQLETAVRHRLITADDAAECRALFDPARWEDFAAFLAERGLVTDGQADRLRQSLTTTQSAPPVPGYEMFEEIGRGGMGIVYRARHRTLDRIDAVKVLPAHMATDEEYVQRFLREARAAGRLAHPNIVRVFDAGPVRNTYYLAMEYVDGPSLEGLIGNEGALPVKRAVSLLAPVARALAHVHSSGIVHRDVKPSNILLTTDDVSKLADLGLAKSPARTTSTLTATTSSGRVLGTVHYMAPEQARSFKEADARADIYALGCTLYHALTGEPPFKGDTAYAVIRQHETVVPPLVERDSDRLSGEMRRLVARMLSKSPANRPQSAIEVADALEAIVSPIGTVTPSPSQGEGGGEGPGISVLPGRAPHPPLSPTGRGTRTFTQLIHGFETKRDLERVTRNNPDCPVTFSLTKKGAVGDGRALLAKFPTVRTGEPPAFHLLDFRHDWAKYTTFSLDIHNHQPEVVLLRLTMQDREEAELERTLELSPGANHLDFAVEELAGEIEVTVLKRITLALQQDTAARLSFDNLCLAGEVKAGTPINAEPDLILVGPQPEADYDDFAPAYMAAQTGDVIEIRSDETYELNEPLHLGWHADGRHIDRDVHIRAGVGSVPSLSGKAVDYTTVPQATMFVEGSATLEGLRLIGEADKSLGYYYARLLSGSRGSLCLSRCYLHCAWVSWGLSPSRGEGEVDIRECYFEDGFLKVMDAAYPLRVSDTVFWRCQPAVQLQILEKSRLPRRFWVRSFERCTFHTVNFPVQIHLAGDAVDGWTLSGPNFVRCALSNIQSVRRTDGCRIDPKTPLGGGGVSERVDACLKAGSPLTVVEGPPENQVADMGFVAPEAGDLRLMPESVLHEVMVMTWELPGRRRSIPLRYGAPNHVAYPDFLYDLAKQAREAAAERGPDSGIADPT